MIVKTYAKKPRRVKRARIIILEGSTAIGKALLERMRAGEEVPRCTYEGEGSLEDECRDDKRMSAMAKSLWLDRIKREKWTIEDGVHIYDDNFIRCTKEVWERVCGKPISDEEAKRIIFNGTQFLNCLNEMEFFNG